MLEYLYYVHLLLLLQKKPQVQFWSTNAIITKGTLPANDPAAAHFNVYVNDQ